MSNWIDDGFGNKWHRCKLGAECGLHVVRPGKAQCWCQDQESSRVEMQAAREEIEKLETRIDQLERENASLREAAPKIKASVSEQLQAALSGLDLSLRYSSDPNYPDQFIRWGLVEKRIHKAVDDALKKEAQP